MNYRAVFLLGLLLIAGAAWGQGIDAGMMIFGGQAVYLADTLQLTHLADGVAYYAALSPDGKQAAVLLRNASGWRLCTVDAAGGKPAAILASPLTADAMKSSGWLLRESDIRWSPDNKMVAVTANKVTVDGEKRSTAECMLALTADGKEVASYQLPAELVSGFMGRFSPDSKSLLMVTGGKDNPAVFLMILDLKQNTVRKFDTKTFADLGGWTSDGAAIDYWSLTPGADGDSTMQLRELKLQDGSDAAVGSPSPRRSYLSPDAKLRAVPSETGVVVETIQGTDSRLLVKQEWPRIAGWSPDSRMLLYQQPFSITDPEKVRGREGQSLWIANLEKQKLNTMCVSLDASPAVPPSWSADGTKIAYVAQGAAYIATLAARPASVDEKLAAGMQLSEDEEKAALLENGRAISGAIGQFLLDAGRLPFSAEELSRSVNQQVFLRPGTDKNIFTLTAPLGAAINTVPGDTVLGELDAGYNWKISVKLGEKAEVVSKPQSEAKQ